MMAKIGKITKWVLTFLVVGVVLTFGCIGLFRSCGANDKGDFTVWIPEGEDSSIYDNYSENPVVKYLTSKKWQAENGKEVKVNLGWEIPSSDSQSEDMARALSTGSYADVIDSSHMTKIKSYEEFYKSGTIIDITEYVEKYMPNYLKYLDAHPQLKKTATNMVDGKTMYLQIYAYQGEEWMWGGWLYRRDWLVKYGKNPSTGASFTGSYDSNGTWSDDVKFPSWYASEAPTGYNSTREWYQAEIDSDWDGSVPVTIADWTWMLGIFKDAISKLGISDGYAMQMYYPGYIEMGDIITSFGGGGGTWYSDEGLTTANFGMTGNGFRYYLQWMREMYQGRYLDQSFNEKTTMFYDTDSAKIGLGKIGLWYGMASQVGNRLDSGSFGKGSYANNDYTKNICVLGARQPINTTYGTNAEKFKEPKVMYQTSAEMRSFVVTDKALKKDKDKLIALFRMFDYMYSDEGSVLSGYGLSERQYAEYKQETGKTISTYEKYATDGAIWNFTDKNGNILTDEQIDALFDENGNGVFFNPDGSSRIKIRLTSKVSSDSIEDALRGSRLWGISARTAQADTSAYDRELLNARGEWIFFRNKGEFSNSMLAQMSASDYNEFTKIKTNIRAWCEKNIPLYIKNSSSTYDVTQDNVWNGLKRNLTNRKCDTATGYLQTLLNKINSVG